MELRKPMISESHLNTLQRQIRPIMQAMKEIFPEKSGQEVGKAWNFPKFHKLCELAYNISTSGGSFSIRRASRESVHTRLLRKTLISGRTLNPRTSRCWRDTYGASVLCDVQSMLPDIFSRIEIAASIGIHWTRGGALGVNWREPRPQGYTIIYTYFWHNLNI